MLKMMRRRRRKGKRRVIGDGSSRITNFIGTSDSFPTNLVDYSCHLRVVRLMLCVSHYCGYVGMLSAFSTDCTSYTTFNIPHLQTRTFFLHNTYYIISSVCIACRWNEIWKMITSSCYGCVGVVEKMIGFFWIGIFM